MHAGTAADSSDKETPPEDPMKSECSFTITGESGTMFPAVLMYFRGFVLFVVDY